MKHAQGQPEYDIQKHRFSIKYVCPYCGRVQHLPWDGLGGWPLPRTANCDDCKNEVRLENTPR